MKRRVTAFTHETEAFCARLNDGLTAVAILLGFLVAIMSVVRASDYFPGFDPSVGSGYAATFNHDFTSAF